MLSHLTLRRFVFMEEVMVDFTAGFCVLTGETGAGKSLLVDALSILAGGRASPTLIMPGAESFEVEAVFDVSGCAVADYLRDNDLCGDNNEMIVRRVAGKPHSRAFINGRQIPLSILTEAMAQTVEICGQHNHYSLRKTAAHRAFLDSFGGAETEAAKTQTDYQQWSVAAAALKQAQDSSAVVARRRDALDEELAELESLDFSVTKWEEQNRNLSRLSNVADLSAGSEEAQRLLEEQIADALSQVRRLLSDLLRLDDKLAAPLRCIEESATAANEAAHALSRYVDGLQTDPESQAVAENFISAAHRLARKYQLADPAKIATCIADKQNELADLAAQTDMETLQKNESNLAATLTKSCTALSKKRKKAAITLDKNATTMLRQLSMPDSFLQTQLTVLESPTAHGAEKVELLISTRKDAPPGAIADIASGGELSRLGLALQIAIGERRAKPVTVFDEVDSGIGGAAASTVGRFLQTLGQTQQVLCVTHLAQVAAHADAHWRVQAAEKKGKRTALIQQLSDEERIEEIARIVGGAKINAAARANAADLLQQSKLC